VITRKHTGVKSQKSKKKKRKKKPEKEEQKGGRFVRKSGTHQAQIK